jgi:8-oxo-dGTP diphosphatase
MQKTTLLFLHKPKEKKVLLGMKKRRFGAGKWNGVGGKLEMGETIKESLVREVEEEIIVTVNEDDLVQVATLDFSFQDNPDWDNQTHVFFTEKWSGEPAETEEMNPMWYDVDALPFENMWVDDKHWLPLVLKGEKLNASFLFNKTGDKILDMKINKTGSIID